MQHWYLSVKWSARFQSSPSLSSRSESDAHPCSSASVVSAIMARLTRGTDGTEKNRGPTSRMDQ